jgi:N-acetylglucosamine kinase-like BadF-type ATPase
MTFIVVGIDGGASKTHAIEADLTGRTLGETVGPGSAVRPGRAEASANVIETVVGEALAACGLSDTPRALAIGVAGIGRDGSVSSLAAGRARSGAET